MAIHFNPQPHGITWTHYRVIPESPVGYDAETVYSLRADYTSRGAGERTAMSNVRNRGQQTLWDARVHRWEHNQFRVAWP